MWFIVLIKEKKICFSIGTIPIAPKRVNRVQIQVFRGANNEEEQYAPWGFVVRQPADTNYHYWWKCFSFWCNLFVFSLLLLNKSEYELVDFCLCFISNVHIFHVLFFLTHKCKGRMKITLCKNIIINFMEKLAQTTYKKNRKIFVCQTIHHLMDDIRITSKPTKRNHLWEWNENEKLEWGSKERKRKKICVL